MSFFVRSYLIQFETSFAPQSLMMAASLLLGVSRRCLTLWDIVLYSLTTSLTIISDRSMANVCVLYECVKSKVNMSVIN